jgi:hypothetical protein
MANTNGNKYPAWIISSKGQILSVAANGTVSPQSPENFAYDLGVSDDGTIWVVSSTPDPDGGGAKIFWGLGDGKWNEINTPNPGGVSITGTGPGACYYITLGGDLWELYTNGHATLRKFASHVVQIEYCSSGALWAVFPDKPGDEATLHFGPLGPNPFTFHLFPGNVSPTSISGNSSGNCYGLVKGKPVQYTQAGTSQVFDQGAKRGMATSFKQGSVQGQDLWYLTTANGNRDGNPVMIYKGARGWVDAGFRAIYTLATYYSH